MKKAIKILGIIFTVTSGIGLLIALFFLLFNTTILSNQQLLQNLTDSMNQGSSRTYTIEEVKAAYGMFASVSLYFMIAFIIAFGLDLTMAIIASLKKELSKYTWIVLGIVTLVIGNFILGILSIIYGVNQSKYIAKDNPTPAYQEVRFTDKVTFTDEPNQDTDNLK